MKISAMIKELKKLKKEYGDLPVNVFTPNRRDGDVEEEIDFIYFESDPDRIRMR